MPQDLPDAYDVYGDTDVDQGAAFFSPDEHEEAPVAPSAHTTATADTNPALEAAALGAAMQSREGCAHVVSITTINDYHLPAHQVVFAAIEHLFSESQPVDEVTVYDQLLSNGTLEHAGGPSALSALLDACPVAAHAERYANRVASLGRNRRVRSLLVTYGQRADSDPTVATQAMDELIAIAQRVNATPSNTVYNLEQTLDASFDWMELIQESDGMLGVPTGLRDLDALLRGLQPSRLYTIAARPAVGKSLLAGTIALNAVLAGHKVMMSSLEMPASELGIRMLSAAAKVDKTRIENGTLTAADWEKLRAARTKLQGGGIFTVDDFGGHTPASIRASVERFASANDGIDLLIVDYLQLINAPNDRISRQEHVAACSRMFKELAKEYRCPVVQLSQLSRQPEQRTDKRPLMSDLRESGGIEQDSDVVALLYRDEVYDPDSPDAGIMEAIIAKNRSGRTAVAKLAFIGHLSLVADLARQVSAPSHSPADALAHTPV